MDLYPIFQRKLIEDVGVTMPVQVTGPVPQSHKHAKVEAAMFGMELLPGTSTRKYSCPKCGGGHYKESSFLLSKDTTGRVRWKCFRATCSFRGAQGGVPNTTWNSETKKDSEIKPYLGKPGPVPIWAEVYLEEDLDIYLDMYTRFDVAQDYFVHTINALGQRRGVHLRRYSWWDHRNDGGPRAISYPEQQKYPFIGHYAPIGKPIKDNGVVVVEDVLSATKLAQSGVPAVALLGTTLNLDRIYDILGFYFCRGKIHLALDKGTRELETKYKSAFSFLFDSWTTWVLDKDLKEVSTDRILKAYVEGATDFISTP